ncbi:hypothetical protein [Nonomuraea endophytica]|uniref:hypothetical protein n=1 Tax=Nonomuraea endophytica TaxID=714136 RepID=UPI0037C8E25D
MAFVPEQTSGQELATARLHPPLHDGVHPRHPDTGEHGLNSGFGEDLLRQRGELAVPVADQKARPAARILQIHHEIPYRLGDPSRSGVSGNAEHADASAGALDASQDVLALSVQGDGLDEVAGQKSVGLRAQEVGPGG